MVKTYLFLAFFLSSAFCNTLLDKEIDEVKELIELYEQKLALVKEKREKSLEAER